MVKSATIFSDEEIPKKIKQQSLPKDSVALTRQEYRQIIKEAYHEGREDAIKEKEDDEGKKETEKNKSPDEEREEIEQKGKEEAIQQYAKEEEANRQRFESISGRQDTELMKSESVFPFTLFTDTLIIDTTKISIAKKQLFATEAVTTIPLKDLSDVNLQTYLFLGTVVIKYMPQSSSPGMNEPVEVKLPNLRRQDAIKIKNILKGILIAKAEDINIAILSPEEIQQVLHKFGESEGVV